MDFEPPDPVRAQVRYARARRSGRELEPLDLDAPEFAASDEDLEPSPDQPDDETDF